MIPLDPTRPVQTRGGEQARILATDLKNEQPLVVALTGEDGFEELFPYYADGTFDGDGRRSPLDLVNVALDLTASAA